MLNPHRRDILGHSLERATAAHHTVSAFEQARGPSKDRVVTGLARFVPRPVLRSVLDAVIKDTLPLAHPEKLEPYAYGHESMVYRYGNHVLKLFRNNANPQTNLKMLRTRGEVYDETFGELVVPEAYFFYESRYHSGRRQLGIVQPFIEGNDLFDNVSRADPSQIHALAAGTARLIEERGELPDFIGKGNVLVTPEGDVRIVDGHLHDPLVRQKMTTQLGVIGIDSSISPANTLQTAVN